MGRTPLRLRLLNDYALVLAGLHAMLAPYADRVRIVEEDIRTSADRMVDLTLYDTFAAEHADRADLDTVLADPRAGAVVVYSWNADEQLVRTALDRGCRGYLVKNLSAAQLVDALQRVADGEIVAHPQAASVTRAAVPAPQADWPGRAEGLSMREAEVIALISQGLTNAEITARSHITINSLKSYIRSAYRKMGVERRSQAVRWGIEHGMIPDPPS